MNVLPKLTLEPGSGLAGEYVTATPFPGVTTPPARYGAHHHH